ncbi:type II toxin-antitoxin system VapB family antitoxin [Sphingomonas sp. AR_OL41]|jgi:antitoxin VapB|uniref:type II toxin-antitoxin system VapB family antitoxin n=1 Tax=Sphingomonas sp. AR_OL41 TaxID=3042729 RepID=UPI0024818C2F|nr:type II toxin-antitoxin system VapB family antitoxin [Sphingomonas sp. AR_OL41]MDH7972006.1 type II toxin-antitoxin system VapB family antitoxin [Sphingomonas sp. AR_OL41]
MASLFIKDSETAALATELAAKLGKTKTEVVRDLLRERKAELAKLEPQDDIIAKLNAWRAANPLPPPTGLKADKAFFDELWGEV